MKATFRGDFSISEENLNLKCKRLCIVADIQEPITASQQRLTGERQMRRGGGDEQSVNQGGLVSAYFGMWNPQI